MGDVQLCRYMRRRWRGTRLTILVSVFVIAYVGTIFVVANVVDSNSPELQHGNIQLDQRSMHRKLLQSNDNSTPSPSPKAEYPPDLFTKEQLKGAVVLYIFGMIYLFIALAIVCDEFFVPALEVIIETFHISEDVAGATFMAAGGSAPELFTSFFGVFVAYNNVGIGTIVGSAVFNILFVIGMCAVFSKGVLQLTWWPLFRDVSFYSISLICFILFFQDEHIYWWEALLLFLCYIAYVIFMKFNADIEGWVKSNLQRNRVTTVRSTDNLINGEAAKMAAQNGSLPALKGSHKFRHGLLQLMIHTIDPLGEEASEESKVHDKALKLHAVASLKVLENLDNHNGPPNETNKNGAVPAISNGQLLEGYNQWNTTVTPVGGAAGDAAAIATRQVVMGGEEAGKVEDGSQGYADARSQAETATTIVSSTDSTVSVRPDQPAAGAGEEDDDNEPLDLSWPKTCRKRLTYILVAPILFPLYITLPDPRRPEKRKFYPWTFIGSIIWIAGFSYLLTWWATVTGDTIGIPIEVMGLTFLAAGTSVPDLITSVIVAKKGFGDMAVSSSVGSNIFDITVGLPIPWLLYGIIYQEAYTVSSKGLFCSVILLFFMLLCVIITIAAFKWKMNKIMGGSMFVFYLVFLAISLLLEYEVFPCPV